MTQLEFVCISMQKFWHQDVNLAICKVDLICCCSPVPPTPNSGIYQPSTSTTKGCFTGILPLLTITHSVYGRFLSLVSWSSTVWTTDCQRRSRLEFFISWFFLWLNWNEQIRHMTVGFDSDIFYICRFMCLRLHPPFHPGLCQKPRVSHPAMVLW